VPTPNLIQPDKPYNRFRIESEGVTPSTIFTKIHWHPEISPLFLLKSHTTCKSFQDG